MSQKGEETKRMIISAANKLFAQKGFKDVSMSDICEETGLSRGGLYRHFSSTSDIFKELINQESSFDDMIKTGNNAGDILKYSLDIMEKEIVQRDTSLSLAIYEFANIGDNKNIFIDLGEKAKNKWIRLIEYGIETGEFPELNPEEVSELILYYYQGLRMWSRVVDVDEKYTKNFRSNILNILGGIGNGNKTD